MARSAKDWAVTKLDYRCAAILMVFMAIINTLEAAIMAEEGNWVFLALAPFSVAYLAYLARGLWRTRP